MKTALVFLLLPFMAFAQPQRFNSEQILQMELLFDLDSDVLAMYNPETKTGSTEIFVTVDIREDYVLKNIASTHFIPKYLTSLHLNESKRLADTDCPSKEAFRSLLVANGLANPTERTPFNWMGPVASPKFEILPVSNNAQGFGPRLIF